MRFSCDVEIDTDYRTMHIEYTCFCFLRLIHLIYCNYICTCIYYKYIGKFCELKNIWWGGSMVGD